jgi:hypothetical protein
VRLIGGVGEIRPRRTLARALFRRAEAIPSERLKSSVFRVWWYGRTVD